MVGIECASPSVWTKSPGEAATRDHLVSSTEAMLNGTPRKMSANAGSWRQSVIDIELEQAVAWRRRHGIDLGRVPGRQINTAQEDWLQLVEKISHLVDRFASSPPGHERHCPRGTEIVLSAHSSQIVTPLSFRYLTLVSRRNHSSSWMIDFRCSFLVVVTGNLATNRSASGSRTPNACQCRSVAAVGRCRACWSSQDTGMIRPIRANVR